MKLTYAESPAMTLKHTDRIGIVHYLWPASTYFIGVTTPGSAIVPSPHQNRLPDVPHHSSTLLDFGSTTLQKTDLSVYLYVYNHITVSIAKGTSFYMVDFGRAKSYPKHPLSLIRVLLLNR